MLNNQQGEVVTGWAVKRVGVVGLGHMGHAFAVNLLQDGYRCWPVTATPSGHGH